MKRVLLAALLLSPVVAFAQQQPPPDPRVSGAMISALQGMLTLREAQLGALKDDTDKRIAELEKLCGDACKKPEGK